MASALEKMKGVQEKFQQSSDLMQDMSYDQKDVVDVRNASSKGKRGAVFGSYSKRQEHTVKASNQATQALKTQQRAALTGDKQLDAANQQTKLLNQQAGLAKQQAMTMRQVHQTMEQILQLLTKEQNKLSPNYQQFAKGEANDPYFGTPEDGMIDKMGSILGDLFGGLGGGLDDLLGGRGNRRSGRSGRSGRTGRSGRAGSPGMWDKIKARIGGGGAGSRIKLPRGGKAAAIAALLGGVAYGGSELWDWITGDEEEGSDIDPKRQAMNGGAHMLGAMGGMGSNIPWQHYANQMYNPYSGGAYMPTGWTSQSSQGSVFPTPAGKQNDYGYNPVLSGAVNYSGLGSISASEESGNKGVFTVSSGKGDHGGVSYGKHQLASRNGSMSRFLNSQEGQKYAAEFAGMQPGSAQFTQKYREIAQRDAAGFEKAQGDYIARTHYQPQLEKVSRSTGVDMSTRGKAVQEMLYSTGVQYGGSTSIIANALKGKNVAGMSDADLIIAVQDYKRATVGQYFRSSAPNVQQSIANRTAREKAKLLALNTQELQAKANGEDEKKQEALTGAEGVTGTQAAAASHPSTTTPQVPAMLAPMKPAGEVAGTMPAVPPLLAPMSPNETAAEAAALPDDVGGPGDFMTRMRTPPKIDLEAPRVTPTPASSAAAPVLEAAEKGAGKGLLKGTARTVGKAIPYVGPAITAAEGASIIMDEEATRAEKERAGSELAGGTAGMIVGAKAGAAGGAALGAGIGSFFFGVGAVPGAAIGGFIGGLGGGALGYWGGSEAGGAIYDAAAGTPEEQAAAEAAKANAPVSGASVVPTTPLVFPMAANDSGQTATQAAASIKPVTATVQSDKPLTPDQISNTVATAVNQATGKATQATDTGVNVADATTQAAQIAADAAKPIVADANQAMSTTAAALATTAAATSAVSSAMPAVPNVANLAAQTTQTGSGMLSKVAGTVAGVASGIAGMGLPEGWASEIASGYAGAQAQIDSAMSGNGMGINSTPPVPFANYQSPLSSQTTSDVAAAPVASTADKPQLPSSQSNSPVVTAPASAQNVPLNSPANPGFYNGSDVSPQASALSAPTPAGAVSTAAAATPSPVTSVGGSAEQVERTPYEPVKTVMALEPKQQNTMMPDRFKPAGERIPARGVSEGNSIRQTLDDAPAVISDSGLVLLQTGYI